MRRVLACAGVVLVAAFGATACGDDDESQSAAEAELCTSLQGFEAALEQVESVQLGDPEANAQNISIARVKATWSGVEQSAKDINEADANALGSSLDDLETAVERPADRSHRRRGEDAAPAADRRGQERLDRDARRDPVLLLSRPR